MSIRPFLSISLQVHRLKDQLVELCPIRKRQGKEVSMSVALRGRERAFVLTRFYSVCEVGNFILLP